MSNRSSQAIRLFIGVMIFFLLLTWASLPVVAWFTTSQAETEVSLENGLTTTVAEATSTTTSSTTCITTTTSVAEEEVSRGRGFSAEERELLARIIYLEAGSVSYECQLYVGSVILNRLDIGYWGDTLEEVIYSPYQFSPAEYIEYTTPLEEQYEVVAQLEKEGSALPPYVLYFRAWYDFDWAIPYLNIDDVYFGYVERDMEFYN